MSYTLFLDDERDPLWDMQDAVVVRNVNEAIGHVALNGLPHVISFDHDLGKGQDSAMFFMWHLIDQHLDARINLEKVKRVVIHSANPVGAENLRGLWDGFAKNELDSGVFAELRPRTTHG